MKELFIELADTSFKRECGLMKRKHLPKNGGMLFKFHYPTFASFWMKDTYIPLDIAFIDHSGKILQIESMAPLSTRAVCSNYSCRYALEVNKGWFEENGIGVGSRVGGEGIWKYQKTAQSMPPMPPPTETPPTGMPPAPPMGNLNQPPQQDQPTTPKPDVMLNLTNEQRLKNAKGKKFIIMYKKKDGYDLPPIVIAPPDGDRYIFEKDEDGKVDAVVKAMDMNSYEIKSFLIDNIKSMEDKK